MADRREQQDWAERVPRYRHRGPYRDYGWEPGQSSLPEFRDPSVHLTPEEEAEARGWRKKRGRSRRGSSPRREGTRRSGWPEREPGGYFVEDFGREGYFGPEFEEDWDWRYAGPYAGIGPRGYSRPDERVREDVCERLTQHGLIDARNIEVQVNEGVVALRGEVQSRQMKRMSEDVAETVSGVVDIDNRLRVERPARGETPNRWRDEVGRSPVYPASEMEEAPEDAEAQGMMSWGQGERGAEGYYDHGESELNIHPEGEGELREGE